MDRKERASREMTRDPIFLFQERYWIYTGLPDGHEAIDGHIWKVDENGEIPEGSEPVSDEELSKITHGDYDIACAVEAWRTSGVFFSREEGEQHGKDCKHRYSNGWRVYCVCAEGELAEILKKTDEV